MLSLTFSSKDSIFGFLADKVLLGSWLDVIVSLMLIKLIIIIKKTCHRKFGKSAVCLINDY
jgi:hypothetical protein